MTAQEIREIALSLSREVFLLKISEREDAIERALTEVANVAAAEEREACAKVLDARSVLNADRSTSSRIAGDIEEASRRYSNSLEDLYAADIIRRRGDRK